MKKSEVRRQKSEWLAIGILACALSVNAQEAGSTVSYTGCLLYKDPSFIVQDEQSMEVVEVHGQDLALNLGNRVEVSGKVASSKPGLEIAARVVSVTGVSPRSQGGCLSVASSLSAKADVSQIPRGAGTVAPASKAGNQKKQKR